MKITWPVFSSGAWGSAQNRIVFTHCVPQVLKYHLVLEYKVEILCLCLGIVPGIWYEYLEKRCVHIRCSSTKCELSLILGPK